MAIDPVCGMQVNENKAKFKASKNKKKFYFCSKNCLEKFENKSFNTKSNKSFEIYASVILILVAAAFFLLGYMTLFMGLDLLVLASLKLIDITGFAERFKQYDLIAKNFGVYAQIYPFLELLLSLMYLFSFNLRLAAIMTIVVMGINTVGVTKKLYGSRKNKIQCACLGAKIKVPLTRFTLVENIVMVIMGVMILFM